jgi:hypothetical protein
MDSTNVNRFSTPESVPAESLASSRTMIVPAVPTKAAETSRIKDEDILNEKMANTRSSADDESLNEKKSKQEMVELQDGLVYLGTEAQSGKAIIKQKDQLQGGPYTMPKW